MSKQEEAGLILKLYELRREETMRVARDWYAREFSPQSAGEFMETMMGAHTGHLRMVITYWDMAAALVNHGAVSIELFNEVNGEHFMVFSRIEPILGEIRAAVGPQFAMNLEKLIDASPNGRKRSAEVRERMKGIMAELKKRQAAAAEA
jgi:hypothetical protein